MGLCVNTYKFKYIHDSVYTYRHEDTENSNFPIHIFLSITYVGGAVWFATASVLLCGSKMYLWEASASSWIRAVRRHSYRQIACTALNGRSGLILEWVTNNMCWCEGNIVRCFRMCVYVSFMYLHMLLVCVCVCVCACTHFLIERIAPPRGAFLCGLFPNEEPVGRGPVLFPQALCLATTQKGKPSGGVGFVRSI
jgi:hypothetical protein